MKAITVEPKKPGTARWEDVPEPDPQNGSVLVEASPSEYVEPTSKSLKANTAGRPKANHASC